MIALAPSDRLSRARMALSAALWAVAAVVVGFAVPRIVGGLSPSLVRPLPIALALAAVGLVLAFARPSVLLVAAIAMLAVVRTEPAPCDLMLALLIVVSVVRGGLPAPRVPPTVWVALGGFAVLSLLSTVNAVTFGRALQFEFTTLYLFVLAIWLTAALQVSTTTRRSIKAYVIAAALSSLFGVLALKAHLPGTGALVYGGVRVQALFKDPNVFGPFLVPAAMIVLEELGRPRLLGWGPRRLLVVLGVLFAGNAFAFSRAAWLNLVVACVTVLLVYGWRRHGGASAARVGFAILLCAIAALGVLAATGELRFLQDRAKTQQTYDTDRFAAQRAGIRGASVHVIGNGPGQSELRLNLATHSLYVRVVFEQGYGGIALLALLLLTTAAAAIGFAFRDGDVAGIGSAALLASWLGLIANSFFVDTLHWRHLWLVAALIWLGAMTSRRAGAPPVVSPLLAATAPHSSLRGDSGAAGGAGGGRWRRRPAPPR